MPGNKPCAESIAARTGRASPNVMDERAMNACRNARLLSLYPLVPGLLAILTRVQCNTLFFAEVVEETEVESRPALGAKTSSIYPKENYILYGQP